MLLGLFFITIGMRLDIGLLFGETALVAGLVVALIGGKAIIESSLILAAYAVNVLSVPISRIVRTIERVRGHRYGELRRVFPKEAARYLDETHALREQLGTVAVPTGAHAVGRTLAELQLANAQVTVNAIRRDGITGREPFPDTKLREGDVVVLFGTPEALERGESILLNG
ncbi:MAG: hypothetical protein KJO27_04735 [Gammaproteobacteria bacterium]|nr:hypothetical protein [Gammaproteobacteria bacterium]NNL44716.1 hypothetical protein [Woeseiaceae bacterium]